MSLRIHQVIADLRPFEGRFGMTWRVALLCALVAAVAMIYKIPEPAIGCYLIIYLMKQDASTNIALAIGATILVTVFVALVFLLTRWTIEIPFLRLAVMALASFAFVYLGSVSKLGDLGSDMALVITFALSLVSAAPFGEAVTRGLLYAWQMVTMPMALMLCFNLVLGWKPSRLLRTTWRDRVEAAADHAEAHDAASLARLRELLREGNADHDQRALLTRVLHYVPNRVSNRLAHAIEQSYALMLAVSALPADVTAEERARLAAHCRKVAAAIRSEGDIPAPDEMPPATDDPALREAWSALAEMAEPNQTWPVMAQEPFFAADALTNPNHQRFALKTTLAAMIAYIVYAGIDWQGIHTAMITCFVASLGTTGETVHKLTLRIIGCLIGAAMGIGAILFVIPNITSVGGLMVLVFVALLPAAWVSSGSERISYGGVQIGLAFLLTVLQGFEPSLDMDSARDRIVGILVGNLLVYLIFTRIWPVGVTVSARAELSSALATLSRLAALPRGDRRALVNEAAAATVDLRQAADHLAVAHYEPASLRPSDAELRRFEIVMAEAEQLPASLLLAEASDPEEAARLARLSKAIASATSPAPDDAGRTLDATTASRATAAERISRIENALVHEA
ncbi:fusaric acid resistance protein [Kaistia sp. 32K]|uniref:FUSC family protein n=1 Tax=Kaistia sp. 32K TaxID=2795690 RepID=UPI001915BE32|nr:FUSC family protein [Kaistia sp. 32K]BCP51487.1 fusaric acid resistance protein [Kaistia sp. 32K]